MTPAALARIAPFAVYMLGIAFEQALRWTEIGPSVWLYPVKAGMAALTLVWFWGRYTELQEARPKTGEFLVAVAAGVLVYALWVRMDWPWAVLGRSAGYNPFQAEGWGLLLAGLRLLGAAAVVPLMEELFWRSFLIRYVIAERFETVPLGTFTPLSCALSIILFGLEHDLWLAGMMAGAVYTGLLYWRRRLWLPVVAHGTTNLALAVHVLMTGDWRWW